MTCHAAGTSPLPFFGVLAPEPLAQEFAVTFDEQNLGLDIKDLKPIYTNDMIDEINNYDRGTVAAPVRNIIVTVNSGPTQLNLPAIFMPAGQMLSGHWRDQKLGSGSDVWKYWAEKRAGKTVLTVPDNAQVLAPARIGALERSAGDADRNEGEDGA